MAWAVAMLGFDPNGMVLVLSPCPPIPIRVRGLPHPLTVGVGHHGVVRMGGLIARGGHVLEVGERPHETYDFHCLLDLL